MRSNPVPQAGAIVFRTEGSSPRVLLVRAKKDPSKWVFPKGHVEPGESHPACALREAREEAGIHGIVLSEVGTSRFASGAEDVEVEYYSVRLYAEQPSPEGREKKWLPLDEAKEALSFPDALRMLEYAATDLERRPLADDDQASHFAECLLHEYDHIAESLLVNEESGEKRVGFFLTLCGFAGAGIGFLAGDQPPFGAGKRLMVAGILAFLTVLGYAILLRVVKRNSASDDYKRKLNRLRQAFVGSPSDPRLQSLAFNPFADVSRPPPKFGFGKGGWAEIMSFIVASLSGSFFGFVAWWGAESQSHIERGVALGFSGVIAFVAGWTTWWQLLRRRRAWHQAGLDSPESNNAR